MTDVYVSHRSGASGFAGPVIDAIGVRLGAEHVADSGGSGRVRPADSDVLIALIDRAWATTRSGAGENKVHDELRTAKRHGVRVIPVMLQGAAMPPSSRLPADLQWLPTIHHEVIRDEAWERDLTHIVEVVITSPVTRAQIQASNAGAVRLARRIRVDVPAVNGVAFTADSREVLAGCSDGVLRVFRLGDGQPSRSVRAHPDRVSALAVSGDGRIVATGSTTPVV